MDLDRHAALCAAFTLLTSTGCAGAVEVTQTYTPAAASDVQSQRFVPVAVVRGTHHIKLPEGARVEPTRVLLPRAYVHKLGSGDVVQEDELGRIVAVRSSSDPPVVTRFVPGTAVSPRGSDEIRGQLADDAASIALTPSDGIEMHGHVEPDDPLPGGGRVESSRATGALIAGIVVFALSYAPTVYVGAGSPRSSDRILALPVAGPWIDLANRPACVPPVLPAGIQLPVDPCIEETVSRVALVASGGLQGLATILTVIGLPSHTKIVEGGGVGARSKPTLAVIPTAGGAAAVGTF